MVAFEVHNKPALSVAIASAQSRNSAAYKPKRVNKAIELLEQNTALTKLTQELSARIEALTAEMHRTLCHQ